MKQQDLLLKQQRLLMRSAELRTRLSEQVQIFKKPLAFVDQFKRGLQWLSRNPKLPLAAVVAVAVVQPRRALAWGGRVWWALKTFKTLRTWVANRVLRQLSA
jgi:hypothetical protein